MNKTDGSCQQWFDQRRRTLVHLAVVAALLLTSFAPVMPTLTATALAAPATAPLAQTTNTLIIQVTSARTEARAFSGAGVTKGDPVTEYKYIINDDNTGTTSLHTPTGGCSPTAAGYPDSCEWVSIAGAASSSPIVTQGDQDDFNGVNSSGLDLPNGRYLISVLADGYKLDGAHFTVPLSGPITVELQPTPLPDATIRAFVFNDISPTNGAPDAPVEQGLAGFVGHLADYLGEVTTDVYGNPLCTRYVGEDPVTHLIDPNVLQPPDYAPDPIPGTGGECASDANGDLVIPHLGPNRYALSVVPPDGSGWIQTTTLEGNHDWDAWVMEGATGYDTEFVVAGEPFPAIIFGYVQPTAPLPSGANTHHITGVVDAFKAYVPATGGVVGEGGMTGAKIDKPIDQPWLSLVDLDNGDTAVWVGQGDANGHFDIANVPAGNYSLVWWDEPQDYILNMQNVTVGNTDVDLGVLSLLGWWTQFDGYVFNDSNRNGVRDPGENGLPNFTLTMRKRENSLMDRGATVITTDATGHFYVENGYPMTQWLVMEAYNDLYYTTGVTYQSDNQPNPTTILGAGVDISVLPIIGLAGHIDWGVHAYDPTGANGIDPRNGGIVGTVSYDTTRNELDAQYAAVEDWQPGISGLTVNLYAPVECQDLDTGIGCDPLGQYQLAADGSYAKGQLLNVYITETWERPGLNGDGECIPRNVNGNPLAYPADQQVTNDNTDCLEGPLMGVQFQHGYSTVDGNYGFADGCFGTGGATGPETCADGSDPIALPGGRDYLVEVELPVEGTNGVHPGRPLYKVTREEDINIGNGDQFIPQVPPPVCAGALHTVDVAGLGTDGYDPVALPGGITVPASEPTQNATFVDIGGSPFEGMLKPLCDTKLVPLNNGKSIVPTFNLFTDVPLPGRFWGLIVDDLNFSANPKSLIYGEKAGVPFAPIGIYDYANRLVMTVESDYNGLWDVLMPSTNRINCPTPSGVCANLYRFVGNDPGVPGALNPNYNPQYRTIAAEFEAIPGLIVPADLAPTQVGVSIQIPSGQTQAVSCALDPATPQLLAVSQPYVNGSGSFTIEGTGFGATAGQVTLDGSATGLTVGPWSDTQITVNVANSTPAGPHQLQITAANGQSTINGLTFHVRRGAYSPTVYEVGPGRAYSTIQAAIDAATASNGDDLVVVYPGTPDTSNPRANPRGAYYENLIITAPIKLQGVGPGGFQGNTFVPGSIIDGGAFGGDTALADAWRAKIATLLDANDNPTWQGNPNVNDGETIYLLALTQNAYGATYKASIDGFDLRGGDQQGFPNNINQIGGGNNGLPPNVVTQGGAIFANAYIRNLQITNNVVQNNGGAYGTIRIGTPDLPAPDTNQHNENLRIANNRVILNAGTNLAGGIGLFAGADNYEVAHNDLCGNFSAEYGGGLTVYGRSPNGKIHHNRIYFNSSYDEGGGIMIAGELPANSAQLSPGSGPVDIYNNLIQANLANDDGGGLRFLMAGGPGGVDAMNVYNNMIVNNVSTHEGGGIGLNDAPNVRVYNNTIMKNLTTATAVTSNGLPAPAGLSTSQNSDLLQATLPGGAPTFSNPLLFNNIFWDNRAGTLASTTVTGLGLPGDATPINYWDIGVADGSGVLTPNYSILQVTTGTSGGTGNQIGADPLVVATYDTSVAFAAWRTNPNFVGAILVAVETPPNLMGDYHLQAASPAVDMGVAGQDGVNAPTDDIDGDMRPAGAGYDSGADEVGSGTPPPTTPILYFSTSGNGTIPGVPPIAPPGAGYDDSDIYAWDGTAFSRVFDANSGGNLPLPGGANVDGLVMVDATHFYLSFAGATTTLAGLGDIQDEDVVYYDNGVWSVYFDGTAQGLTANAQDLDAIKIAGNILYFSTAGNGSVPGVAAPFDDADIYAYDFTTNSFSRVFDASVAGLPNNANVDGLSWIDANQFYLSFSAANTSVPGLGSVEDEDIVQYGNGLWSVYFDGTALGLTDNPQNLDAFSFAEDVPPPPIPEPAPVPVASVLYVSTAGNTFIPGVPAISPPAIGYDDADIYAWDGTAFSRVFDANSGGNLPLPGNANIDGLQWLGDNHYYLSFAGAMTNIAGLGTVEDEDVVEYNNGAWSVYFDGTAAGLLDNNQDVDAVSIVGDVLYFSTVGNMNPPGAGGSADDADIYAYDRTTMSFSRVFDASVAGLPNNADIDGLVWIDANNFYVSFNANSTTVPGLGGVADEDVVQYSSGIWSLYFDGAAAGLNTSGAQDLNAFSFAGMGPALLAGRNAVVTDQVVTPSAEVPFTTDDEGTDQFDDTGNWTDVEANLSLQIFLPMITK
ncbi:MAG: IPT/TIG domain-containing protein [Caldilineaceae bacterium]